MSWRGHLSRHLRNLRFFACPDSPSSHGVLTWYTDNYAVLRSLNPNMPLMLRTTVNAMPAVVAELDWTVQHLLRFMIQTGRFRDPDGSISQARVEAAKAFLATDWNQMKIERFKVKGFDPEYPFLDEDQPHWRDDLEKSEPLATYFSLKKNMEEQMKVFQSGPNDEYLKAQNALLMCQRVDLYCAGPKEVERAVVHLYKLARSLNSLEPDFPPFIMNFYPGSPDMVPYV